ncbi:uncharacterized protein LOC143251107 isoform X2 [Tachypleus tridentatus]|uniref:uncharacterized protein LOC143251107 isoform X2 n=1 Tax=Tachypleus tridentatus TaxID=6853 RepID=UPI003FCF4B56
MKLLLLFISFINTGLVLANPKEDLSGICSVMTSTNATIIEKRNSCKGLIPREPIDLNVWERCRAKITDKDSDTAWKEFCAETQPNNLREKMIQCIQKIAKDEPQQ